MKKIMLVILVAITATSCFTPKMVTFQNDEFVKVYEDVPGTKNDLYLKANEWLVGIFNNAKSIIQHTDKEEGVIIGKYMMKTVISSSTMYGSSSSDVYAIIDIRLKDNKARISIKPYDYAYVEGMYQSYTKEQAVEDMEALAQSFHQSLQTKKVDF